MVEDDKYTDKEFDSEHEMHLYWAENIMDELNSHDKKKAKKARRKEEDRKKDKMRKRKQLAGWSFAAVLAIGFIALAGTQIMQMTPGQADFDHEDRIFLGEEDAPVEIAVFEDYRCSYCGNFNTQTLPQIEGNEIADGQAKLYSYHFPVLGPESTRVATATECVKEQSAEEFWNYHKSIYNNQNSLQSNTEYLVNLAEQSTEGLEYEEIEACIDENRHTDQVQHDVSVGNSAGVSGTPTVFVNGERTSSDYHSISAKIQEELEE